MTQKQKYIELIRKEFPKVNGVVYFDLNNNKAKLVEENSEIFVMDFYNEPYELDVLEIDEILAICYELNIEPRMDYLIMNEDNQWLGTGKFATQPEIDTHIEDILRDYDEDRPELTVFTAEEMSSFNI